jgi:sterol desaturase/sphingolipid hydroxylase (fatty acid hydroxylase superfamily)
MREPGAEQGVSEGLTQTSTRGVKPARLAMGLGVLVAWSAAMVALAGQAAPIAAIAAILFTIPLISLGEWWVHGVMYHRALPGLDFIREIHTAGHHGALFPPKHYVQAPDAYPFMRFRAPKKPWRMADNALDNALTSWSQVGLHFVVGLPLIMLPVWLMTGAGVFFWSSFATLGVVSWLLAYVHGCIHTPRNRLIEHMRWYQWLDRHHYIHHIDQRANINFLLPICDVLFGTLKRRVTESEARRFPSFEEAKPMAKDIGRRAASVG